jgi:drug/metabolite transporter (DMT)-like permease
LRRKVASVIGLVIRIVAFICIFYYVQGRNWARIAVLLTSIVAILSLIQLRHEDVPGQIIGTIVGLLGVFFLYWLNKRSVREFFKGRAATIGPS